MPEPFYGPIALCKNGEPPIAVINEASAISQGAMDELMNLPPFNESNITRCCTKRHENHIADVNKKVRHGS